jgi:putative beta-barrel porin MtrB/PioB
MRIKAFATACGIAAGMLPLGASVLSGQGIGGQKITVAGEVGPRGYADALNPRQQGKFDEYRDFRSGQSASAAIEQLLLKYTPADSFGTFQLSARQLFQRDQSMRLIAKQPGIFDFQVRWDRIVHTYSTTARSPGVENIRGFNTLPLVRPDSIAWRNAPYLDAIRSQWDPVKVSLGVSPTNKLDSKAEYTRISKLGGIPMSMSYSGSSGPQREFVAPIDQTMNDFRLSQGFVSGDRTAESVLSFIKSYQLTATYDYSRFHNGVTATMVDNPQVAVSSRTGGAATARASLAPSNAAQAGTITGVMQLPMRTRFTGSLRGSWQTQNDRFFPQTSNDSLRGDPNYGLLTLPRSSLNGKARTVTLNLSANAHPVNALTLAARYRTYDYSNQTAPFHIRAMAISDRSIALGDSLTSEVNPFTKTNSDFSASYLLLRGLSFTGSYGIEDWKREAEIRNVAKTTEKTPRASVDYTGIEWLNLHASYSQGTRRGGDYTQAATEILGFRRFDLADRDRKLATVMASVTPIDQVTLGAEYRLADDKFPHSQYGTQSDKSTMTGFDVDVTPVDRVNVSVGYSTEKVNNILNSRYRTGAAGTPTYDNPTYKWTNRNTDKDYTTYANLNAVLVPDRLDFVGSLSIVDAHFWVYNVNPTTPTGGTATQNLSATVENWPEVSQRMTPIALGLRYRQSEDWAFTLRFQSEKYNQTDFRTVAPIFTNTGLSTGTPITSFTGDLPGSIGTGAGVTGQYHFLGNNFRPYNVQWVTLLVTYHPSMLPFRVGRSTF